MNNKKSKNYIFENDTLRYESFNDEFTSKQFKEFNSKSKELKLTSKIANLINGELVNECLPCKLKMAMFDCEKMLPIY